MAKINHCFTLFVLVILAVMVFETLACKRQVKLNETEPLLNTTRLAIQGRSFLFKGQKVFLSGGNLPWINYGHDFGDNQYSNVKSQMITQFQLLQQAGGNSMRLWIHIQGESSPAFDQNGFVTGLDITGSFVNDFIDMLDNAKDYNILMFPTLWNGAVNQDRYNRLDGLIRDTNKLQSYIDNALIPLVNAVKGHPALGAWDIMNEPEGMITPGSFNIRKCYNTIALLFSGVGWAGYKYNYQQILRFINLQAAAIKDVDPMALVTTGVWNPKSNTNIYTYVDHYTDSCLSKAGGKLNGILDFYQFHTYPYDDEYDYLSPFKKYAEDYDTSKPIVVGEFWTQDGGHLDIYQQFDYIYNHSYSGGWSWDLVKHGDEQRKGINHIKDFTWNGKIPINV